MFDWDRTFAYTNVNEKLQTKLFWIYFLISVEKLIIDDKDPPWLKKNLIQEKNNVYKS